MANQVTDAGLQDEEDVRGVPQVGEGSPQLGFLAISTLGGFAESPRFTSSNSSPYSVPVGEYNKYVELKES